MTTAASTSAIPEGMSKTDFKHWKAEQTGRAKERLSSLEERLQRLQLLDSKMRKLRAGSTDVETSATTSLHGAVDLSVLSANPYAPPTSSLGSYDAGSALVSAAARGGPVGRPVTPGTIRRIIRSRPSWPPPACVSRTHRASEGRIPTVSYTPARVGHRR